jgi:CelD/BcsL family acetyltransferase involved in cellulose biosynthesis
MDKSARWLGAPETEEFFTTVAREGFESGRTWLTVLSVDGTTIAAKLSFREGTTLYASKAAYEPAWHAYSPGRTLQLLTIERAFAHGIEKCDLMIGGQGWLKDKLATGKITVWKEGLTQR